MGNDFDERKKNLLINMPSTGNVQQLFVETAQQLKSTGTGSLKKSYKIKSYMEKLKNSFCQSQKLYLLF